MRRGTLVRARKSPDGSHIFSVFIHRLDFSSFYLSGSDPLAPGCRPAGRHSSVRRGSVVSGESRSEPSRPTAASPNLWRGERGAHTPLHQVSVHAISHSYSELAGYVHTTSSYRSILPSISGN